MNSRAPRRYAYVLAVVAVVVVVGLLAVPGVAGERAAAAERSYVADQLADRECLSDWGVSDAAVDTSVRGVAGLGLRVSVTVEYHAVERDGDGGVVWDVPSQAEYRVGPTGVERLGGDDVPNC